jgi:hypothetical protein
MAFRDQHCPLDNICAEEEVTGQNPALIIPVQWGIKLHIRKSLNKTDHTSYKKHHPGLI